MTLGSRAEANYIFDIGTNVVPPFSTITTVFPNWVRVPAAAFTVYIGNDTIDGVGWCETSRIIGLTIMNYGTASGSAKGGGGDIEGVYFQLICNATNSGLLTMTYAGNWTVGALTYPAWTWAGAIDIVNDPSQDSGGGSKGCGLGVDPQMGGMGLYVYADIGPCPQLDASGGAPTVQLGPGFNDLLNAGCPGGLYEWAPTYGWACSCGNWGPVTDPAIKTIRYLLKEADKEVAAPGDTINYTIYFGTPGSGVINDIFIMDTKPAYTHVLSNCGWSATIFAAVPVLDPGPPERLRWQVPGPINTAGGATRAVSFCVTVDWGANAMMYPQAGEDAAPEGMFLFNNAHLSWTPSLGCSAGNMQVSNKKNTVVKRYLFWKIGDQDVLLAPRLGLPDDEIIYDIFVKNLSNTMTWWNVRVWDTIPAELDVWSPGFGVYDPCVGWTMTPTGCAGASPNKVLTGAKSENTLIYWSLDMPPAFTLSLRIKGKLKPTTAADVEVTNRAAVRAYGIPASIPFIDATGDAKAERNFTSKALVKLRTTYVSYVGWAADDNAWFKGCVNQVYFISFYPLNKACNFQLYKKWCCTAVPPCELCPGNFHVVGGVSPRINVPAGTCTGPVADWEPGCGAERAPARFVPSQYRLGYDGKALPLPYNFLHKMLSNAPMVWELSMCLADTNQDVNSYAGTTSLSFAGYIAYSFLRRDLNSTGGVDKADCQDALHIVNTSETMPTTVFVFDWEPITKTWNFLTTKDIYNHSQWAFSPTRPDMPGHHRVVSSDTKLIVQKAWLGIGRGGAYNDLGTLAPNRENGGLVSTPGVFNTNFYLFCGNMPYSDVAVVGHVLDGGAQAVYDIMKYVPDDPTMPSPSPSNISPDLVGNSGTWKAQQTNHTVAGVFVPGANAHVYGNAYDTSGFTPRYALYRVVLKSGGPIMTYAGRAIIDQYSGGSMLHTSNQLEVNGQTGNVYWLHGYESAHSHGGHNPYVFDVFCPKVNLRLNLRSSDGYSATYTTNDVDECIAFTALTMVKAPGLRNWKIEVQDEANSGCETSSSCNPGRVIAQYINCNIGEKFYTAPFLSQGVYYDILTPPAVFTGQDFWITIVVKMLGDTVTDYCGTTAFTASDPKAQIEGSAMGGYTFTWSSSKSCSVAPNEDGVKIFVRVNFTALGLQTLVASDIYDGSITGLASFMVVGADIKLFKEPAFGVAASGDTVRFRVCWSNYSTASGVNVVITDAIPMGTTYVPGTDTTVLCSATPGKVPTVQMAWSSSSSAVPPTDFASVANPTQAPVSTRWLRWTLGRVDILSSGCVCYRVGIN